MEKLCPECNGALVTKNFEGNEVSVCTNCKGIWFHAGELQRIQSAHAGALEQLESQAGNVGTAQPITGTRVMDCPDCCTRMVEHAYSLDATVTIAVCPSCQGIWIEHGELKRIAASLGDSSAAQGGTPPVAGSRQDAPPPPGQVYNAPAATSMGMEIDSTTGIGGGFAPIADVPATPSQPLVSVIGPSGQMESMPANLANPRTQAEREARAIVDSMDAQTQSNYQTAQYMWALARSYRYPGMMLGMFGGFGW